MDGKHHILARVRIALRILTWRTNTSNITDNELREMGFERCLWDKKTPRPCDDELKRVAEETIYKAFDVLFDETSRDALIIDPVDDQQYLYTQFEVADSRRMYACFEQPDLKAPWQLTVTGPSDWVVTSNSATPDAEPVREGVSRWEFPATKPISTYITALVAGPYHVVRDVYEGEHGTYPLGVFCRKSLAEYLDSDDILLITKQGFEFEAGRGRLFGQRFDMRLDVVRRFFKVVDARARDALHQDADAAIRRKERREGVMRYVSDVCVAGLPAYHSRGARRSTPSLLPVLQGADGDAQQPGELALGQACLGADRRDVRHVDDPPVVAAEHGARPDRRLGAEDDVADEDGVRVHVGGARDPRQHAVVGVDRHQASVTSVVRSGSSPR